MRPIAKERILLHLLEHVESPDNVEVSPELAQEGVSHGSGIELRHLAQYIKPLIRDGLVHERTAHVKGIRQRRKVYELTHSGRGVAIRLKERMKASTAPDGSIDGAGTKTLQAWLKRAGVRTDIMAVPDVQQARILDTERPERPAESLFVDQTWDAPRAGTFVGRREELLEILREDGDPRVFVIRGIAGIGKTALAAKACEIARGHRNLFWHRIRPWETGTIVLASLGQFLRTLDHPGLSSVLRRGEAGLAAEVLRQDLADANALLVFDDAHEASLETLAVLRMLAEAVASAPDVRILILSRRALSFYDIRDVGTGGMVHEIELGGLSPEDAAALAINGGDSAALAGLGRRLAGHPLFIELVRSHRADIPRAIHDVRRFMEVTVYRELSREEKAIMKAASLYQVPMPRQTMLSIPGSSYEALLGLQDRSLVRFVGGDRYEVHDTIREFFRDSLTPNESRRFGTLAVSELQRLAVEYYELGDFISCVNYLSNAIRLSRNPRQRAEIWECLGDAEQRMGDPPAAIVAYRESVGTSKNPESVARLHRKLAATLHVLGEAESASAEAETAFKSLGTLNSVERGWLNLVRSRMFIAAENWEKAREHAEVAIRTFRSFQDARGKAETLVELALVQTSSPSGDPGLANRYLEDALRLSAPIADPALAANIRVKLAHLHAYRLGDAGRAMEHLETIEALPGAFADIHSRQSLLMLKGWFNLDLRAAFEESEENFVEALALSWKLFDPVTAASAKQGAAMAAYHAGDNATAQRQLEKAASELLALGYAGQAVEAMWTAAESCLAVGDIAGFHRLAAKMNEPALARGLELRPVVAHILAGIECLHNGDRKGVRAAFLDAIRIAEREVSPQERPFIPFAHDMFSASLWAMGEYDEATIHHRISIDSAERYGLKGRLIARSKIMDSVQISLRKIFENASPTATKSYEASGIEWGRDNHVCKAGWTRSSAQFPL